MVKYFIKLKQNYLWIFLYDMIYLSEFNNLMLLFLLFSRFYIAVLSGCLSGTLCLTGLYGIAFYLLMSVLFSFVLLFSVQVKKGTFFLNNSNVFTHGIMNQVMVSNFLNKICHIENNIYIYLF